MNIRLSPQTEARIQELARTTGRGADDLIEDALTGYLQELAHTRDMLESRYDDLKLGHVEPLDGEEAFADNRRKSESRRARS